MRKRAPKLLMRLAILFAVSSLAFKCKEDEPKFDICAIFPRDKMAYCFQVNKDSTQDYIRSTESMTGFLCTSPSDFSKLKFHHKKLHMDLEEKDK